MKLTMKSGVFPAILALAFAMFVNVWHPYLWGPDEPRESEIAREIYESGNYVTPHFCGIPFVEKPPLYHDIVALIFHVTGPVPGAARLISALFGLAMMLAVFHFAKRWKGVHCAILSAAALFAMPQFYRAAHWILLDIGSSMFATAALLSFACRIPKESRGQWPVTIFYLMCAGAFLTKGAFTLFYIGLVCGVYVLFRSRWDMLKTFLWNWRMLLFLLPSGLWIWLFAQEGGWFYIHEHFINNIWGRFIGRNLTLPGTPVLFTDVGNSSPWYFYLKRFPNMFGGMLMLLPFALYAALCNVRLLPAKWRTIPRSKPWQNICSAICLGRNEEEPDEMNYFLLIGFLVPFVVLSFPTIKEVTYTLPSYAMLALLIGNFLHARIADWFPQARSECETRFALVLGTVACIGFLAGFTLIGYFILLGAGVLFFLFALGKTIRKKDFQCAILLLMALACAGVVIGNVPELMNRSRIARRCYRDLARIAWEWNGPDRELCVYSGTETLRGSIPFYGNRTTIALRDVQFLFSRLRQKERAYSVILERGHFERLQKNREFAELTADCEIRQFPELGINDDFTLILSPER